MTKQLFLLHCTWPLDSFLPLLSLQQNGFLMQTVLGGEMQELKIWFLVENFSVFLFGCVPLKGQQKQLFSK